MISNTRLYNPRFQPRSLQAGAGINRSIRSEYRDFFNRTAAGYLSFISEVSGIPVFSSFTPGTMAEIALRAFVPHEFWFMDKISGRNRNEQNITVASQLLPFPAIERSQISINYDDPGAAFGALIDLGADHLSRYPGLKENAAKLCAYYFASGRTSLCSARDFAKYLNRNFGFNGKTGNDLLDELAGQGKTVADLAMGPCSAYYIERLTDPPDMTLTDIDPFSLALNRTFIKLLERSGRFHVHKADLTAPASRSPLTRGSIGHAQVNYVTHHIEENLLDKVARFLLYVLQSKGTFTIWDSSDNFELPEMLLASLQKTGFSAEISAYEDRSVMNGDYEEREFAIYGERS